MCSDRNNRRFNHEKRRIGEGWRALHGNSRRRQSAWIGKHEGCCGNHTKSLFGIRRRERQVWSVHYWLLSERGRPPVDCIKPQHALPDSFPSQSRIHQRCRKNLSASKGNSRKREQFLGIFRTADEHGEVAGHPKEKLWMGHWANPKSASEEIRTQNRKVWRCVLHLRKKRIHSSTAVLPSSIFQWKR